MKQAPPREQAIVTQVTTNVHIVRNRPLRQPTGGAAPQDLSLPSTKTNWQLDQFIRSVPESVAPAAAPATNAAPAAALPNYRLLNYKTQAAAPTVPAVPSVAARMAPPSPTVASAPPVPAAPVTPVVPTVPPAIVAPPPPVVVDVPVTPPAPPAPVAPTPAPAPGLVLPAQYTAMVDQSIQKAESELAAFEAAMNLLMAQIERRHGMPEKDPVFNDFSPPEPPASPEKPERPDRPARPPADKPDAQKPSNDDKSNERLKNLSPAELARLGRENKKEFFAVLRPAAEEAERKYGVPAAITLAQAALETGWGQHIIPGFNIFGIKGTGPAGTVRKGTWEVYGGKKVTITASFAKYHSFYEAVLLHGKLFHNGYYTKAMDQFKKDKDPFAFARNITGTYATDPAYGSKLSSIMRQYNLV